MRGRLLGLSLLLVLSAGCQPVETVRETDSAAEEHPDPRNYIYFNRDRERISEPSFLENAGIAGAQLKYTWRELEPERDRYELAPVLADLAYLQQRGKRLFIQLQEVLPAWLCSGGTWTM